MVLVKKVYSTMMTKSKHLSSALWWIKTKVPIYRWFPITDRQKKILLEIQDKIPEITIRDNEIWKTKKDEKQNLHS